MGILLWAVGFIVAALLGGNTRGPIMMFPVMGIAPALAAAIPGIIGLFGSLFGKKQPKQTQYTGMQNPQQAALMQKLLAMIGGKMGQQSAGMQPTNDALNMLYSQFLGRPFNPQGQAQPQQPQQGGGTFPYLANMFNRQGQNRV